MVERIIMLTSVRVNKESSYTDYPMGSVFRVVDEERDKFPSGSWAYADRPPEPEPDEEADTEAFPFDELDGLSEE